MEGLPFDIDLVYFEPSALKLIGIRAIPFDANSPCPRAGAAGQFNVFSLPSADVHRRVIGSNLCYEIRDDFSTIVQSGIDQFLEQEPLEWRFSVINLAIHTCPPYAQSMVKADGVLLAGTRYIICDYLAQAHSTQ